MNLGLAIIFGVLLALAPEGVAAGEHEEPHHEREDRHEHDEDKALLALKKGEILPLEKVMEKLRAPLCGEIIGVELEREHGTWIYEFKCISPTGRVVKARVNAKTGELLEKSGE